MACLSKTNEVVRLGLLSYGSLLHVRKAGKHTNTKVNCHVQTVLDMVFSLMTVYPGLLQFACVEIFRWLEIFQMKLFILKKTLNCVKKIN